MMKSAIAFACLIALSSCGTPVLHGDAGRSSVPAAKERRPDFTHLCPDCTDPWRPALAQMGKEGKKGKRR